MKGTFLGFEVKVVLLCHLEYVLNCSSVISHVSPCGYTNIVHVNVNGSAEGFMLKDNIAVYVVHHGLECGW